ncbi:MAG: PBSX family phage terminase large subunit [Dysgonomonas sp.]
MKSSETLLLEKPPLFFANYEARERIVVNQGGTSSGKTYTLVDLLFVIAMQQQGQVLTVVGQDIPNLKVGAFRDAKTIWNKSEIYRQWFSRPNITDRVFTCINGSVIEFKSYSDEQDARSGKRDYLFVNEANGISYPLFWQLAARTRKKIFLDYNPTARFWVHEELIGKPDVRLIISDHRHNPFLSGEEHTRLESITDPQLFKVYARGLTGKIEGLIYNDWQLTDEMPQNYKKRYIGIDFGFTNDPTAILDVRLSEGELWIDELAYSTGLTNPDIAAVLHRNGISSSTLIIADSAEPKSIVELRNMGFRLEGALKGQDSIKNGIDILKRYRLNITRRSKGIRKEITAYRWKEDRNGYALNQPVDEFNHALDALRYVALNKLGEMRRIGKPKARTTSII